ncbi:MAG: STAS domain-containing protein [Marmoricola sp.]
MTPSIELDSVEGLTVVRLTGEFDIGNVDELRDAFAKAISADSCNIVVDLAQTGFMDSMALGCLIGARKRSAGWGGWVRLAGPTGVVRRALEVTSLTSVFDIFDDVDAACGRIALDS